MGSNKQMDAKNPLWKPSQSRIDQSNMMDFLHYVNEKHSLNMSSYDELYDWSVDHYKDFWKAIWEKSEMIHSGEVEAIHIPANRNDKIPRGEWFTGAKLNFAENLLRYKDDKTAIIAFNESREERRITYGELNNLVAKCAFAMRQLGVVKGDRVAGYISNIPEAIIAMLAASSIGAIWSSTSPDFGYQGVLDRFGQIKPKVLFAVDGYAYNAKKFNIMPTIESISESIPEIEKIVIIPEIHSDLPASEKYINYNDFVSNDCESIEFEQLDFDHPQYIMYSSGTTGTPKCIVHGAGGTLLQHYKELALHTDLKREDVIMYFTTCGWMMWNWLVSSLMTGSTVFLYDGSPGYSKLRILWEAIEKYGITVFGTSPKFLSAVEQNDIIPKESYDLSSLKTILSTGSPLSENNFDWVYSAIKEDLQLSSISGGTDIISCFMLGNPILPVYSGEIQSCGLGMKVEAYDESQQAVRSQQGELVCTEAFPSMPIYFWNDEKDEKYHSAYFDYFPGIWRHGDFIEINDRGGVIVYGRSDATLNPGGVRIGTAEIYRVVENIEGISDSLVIGQKHNDDIRIILFVVLVDGFELDEKLEKMIGTEIKSKLTPRHLPKIIRQVDEIPHTLNGKKVEIAVSRIINGQEVTNQSALANPESLKQYEGLEL
jgi:acetoacetyl-CoA synthetase